MTSPLVEKIHAKISTSSDLNVRAALVAELGCYLARTGNFESAETLRAELRVGFGDGRCIQVSIMIMCLEALLLYYRDLNPDARDRMARAHLLSGLSRDNHLISLTSAWMAHIDFNLNNFDSMASALETSFNALSSENYAAESRVSIVLGDAFLYAGDIDAAKLWYERGRQAALEYGDQAAIGAMVYNRAALRVAIARLADPGARTNQIDAALIRAEVLSAINFQAITRIKALDHLLQSAMIGAFILEERFEEAGVIIERLIASAELKPGTSQALMIQADQALVWANTRRLEDANERIDRMLEIDLRRCAADDRALIYSALLRAAETCGRQELLEELGSKMNGANVEHQITLSSLRQRLSRYLIH
jgi:hypothetical protein